MFYEFNQNNSGGSLDFDENDGITHFVVVEADDLQEAIHKAEKIGLYFDGCDNGIDCPCCGDRWYAPWKDDGEEFPTVYGSKITEKSIGIRWMQEGKEVCVHYADGRKEWH